MENNIYDFAKKIANDFNYEQYKNINYLKQVEENITYIKKAYYLLNKFQEVGIRIHPAGEWLLDNLYIIEKEAESVINCLKTMSSNYKLTSKVYNLAQKYVKIADAKIDVVLLQDFLKGYSEVQYLSLQELWIFPLMLKIVLIQTVCNIVHIVVENDKQKYKVESIIEKYILNSDFKKRKYILKFEKKKDEQINLPFIEYMAYRLKEFDKDGLEYSKVFDEQVLKLGVSVDEAVSKQHHNVIIKQSLMASCIISLKDINNINFEKEFENISEIDQILINEKANVYKNMSFETLKKYRQEICKIAKETKTSEKYICKKIIELCNSGETEKAHCGYYLFSKGKKILYKELGVKYINPKRKNLLLAIYLTLIFCLTYIATVMYVFNEKNVIAKIVLGIAVFIPLSQCVISFIDKIVFKITKPYTFSMLDYENGLPTESKTFCIIPTLITSEQRVYELVDLMEQAYLTNKQENIFFAILGDCSESDEERTEIDDTIQELGQKEISRLNQKYGFDNLKFNFLYRKRRYNEKQEKYLGWERKRGLITQFNRFLLYNETSDFLVNTIDREKIGEIKYVLTIDADTVIGINNISKLAGIMAHPLNHPILNKAQTAVVSGYGLLQPRIAIDIECADRNIFSKILGGYGGIDIYTNAVSDIYQDVWNEGIFTGKGIFDLKIFSQVLDNQIPENTVLSHDLLEGSFLRCGLVTTLEFIDGFPSRYNSYIVRKNRWLRGDLQICRWLKRKVKLNDKLIDNPLNKLSKWKIVDNIRRGTLSIWLFIYVFLGITVFNINYIKIILIYLLIYVIPNFIDSNNFRYKRLYVNNKKIGVLENSIYTMIFQLIFLPYEAFTSVITVCKTIYRINISHKYMLEWLTAEQAEKLLGKNLKTYICSMAFSIITGAFLLTVAYINNISNYFIYFLSLAWIVSPIVAYIVSNEKNKKNKLVYDDKEYLNKVAKDTWKYFNDYLIEENNYLIPDNYQETRKNKIVKRTSPTNIALSLVSVVSAYDLGYIDKKRADELITNVILTVEKLKKYKGNLYNWYDIQTLEPLNDNISSVDSGNFVAYLYIVKDFCDKVLNNYTLTKQIKNIINQTDLSLMYDDKKGIFSIEYNTRTLELSKSYYDLLASESRILSYVAIAKGDVTYGHWNNLGRGQVKKFGQTGLISWTGTSFEYFMPYEIMNSYKYSLLEQTYSFSKMCQQKYCQKKKVPFGISESAFNLYDIEYNYQYKAFGIPWLGLKRGLKDDLVISPYASILMLNLNPKEVINNMKKLQLLGVYGKYGYYESIDYTKNRVKNGKYAIVKTVMAHHQGMILLAINNMLNDNIIKKRFMSDNQIKSVSILLKEKMQTNIVIENKENEKMYEEKQIKENCYEMYEEVIDKTVEKYNVLNNNGYTICLNNSGDGFSKYDDIYVYRYNKNDYKNKGIKIYIKDAESGEIYDVMEKANVIFTLSNNIYFVKTEDLEIEIKVVTLEQSIGEIRNIKVRNIGYVNKNLEIFIYFEPILSKLSEDLAHRAYNVMSIENENVNNILITHKRKKNIQNKDIFLGTKIITDKIASVDYDVDRDKLLGRNRNIENSNILLNEVVFSNKSLNTIEPAIAYKVRIIVQPEEVINVALVININNDKQKCISDIDNLYNYDCIKNTFELINNKVMVEAEFNKILSNDVKEYLNILTKIMQNNVSVIQKGNDNNYMQSNLWKYGISGDNSIVTVNINRKIETIYINQILEAYKYLKRKGIDFDLVFQVSNYKYCKEIISEVEKVISIKQLKNYLYNGIFILDIQNELINKFAKLVINCSYANNIITEKKYFNVQEVMNINNVKGEKLYVDTENLKYYNEIGGFKEDNSYQIILNDGNTTPAPWVNVLANPNFGTILSENGCVYTWCENSSQYKISKWSNDQVTNSPSEYIEITDSNNIKFSPTIYPYNIKSATYLITHGQGYSIYESCINGIKTKQIVYISLNDNVKVNVLAFTNTNNDEVKLEASYVINILLGNEIQGKMYKINEKNNYGISSISNVYIDKFKEIKTYMYCYELCENNIVKNGNINFDNLTNQKINLNCNITIQPNETKKVIYIIGAEKSNELIEKNIEKYSNYFNVEKELLDIKEYWQKMSSNIKVKTPIESINILLNNLLMYQTLSSRIYAKTGFYQSSGAYGFRDQLQDMLCLMYSNPEMVKQQIIYHAQHQYIQGDVMHWWHSIDNAGIRSKCSDDLLWLAYITFEYVKITGDDSILKEKVSYIESNELSIDEKDRYEIPKKSNISETLIYHILRAIDKVSILDEKNLPSIGTGDWNDGLNNIDGQSVWLGFFLMDILKKTLPIIKDIDAERYNKYIEVIDKLKVGLNNSWDGKWFKRAYLNTGEELGSNNCLECKIDAIAQAWSVISGTLFNEKAIVAMKSVDAMLVDEDNKLIKLFMPSFDKINLNPGYIKSYLPGIRENGGQYTHAAIWVMLAQCLLGNGNIAEKYFRILNPIEHSMNKESAKKYRVEPYVMSADVYSANQMEGRGGWTWYTGSASWMYKVGIENILGLQKTGNYLEIKPCINSSWNKYEIWYMYYDTEYHIIVKNPSNKENGVEEVWIDNKKNEDKKIILVNDKINHEVVVIM